MAFNVSIAHVEKILQNPKNPTHLNSIKKTAKNIENTEGPLRQILKDTLADERMKLPLRFS